MERVINVGFTDDTKAAELMINNEIDHCLDLRPRTIETILIQAPHVITFSGRDKPYGYVDWWPISMYFNTLEEPYTTRASVGRSPTPSTRSSWSRWVGSAPASRAPSRSPSTPG